MPRPRQSFHFEDHRGNVIQYEDYLLTVWTDKHQPWTSETVDPNMASKFLAWSVVNGPDSAVVYHNSGEMYL